jgi:8-oxo-dGTP diphosphatase
VCGLELATSLPLPVCQLGWCSVGRSPARAAHAEVHDQSGARPSSGRRYREANERKRAGAAAHPSFRRNDWTFPKGKVEAGETDEACALREVEEETGLRCAPESELATTAHINSEGRLKEVRYWLMRPVGGEAAPHNEVDAVRWVSPARAVQLLTYQRDRDLLDRLPSN